MTSISTLAAVAAFGAALAGASAVSAAAYLPTGPQLGVSLGAVTGGGWSLCYQATMGTAFGNSTSETLSSCTGSKIMLAGRETGSDTLLVLAQADRDDVFFDTGTGDTNTTHTANGAEWYNADFWSWGFAPEGESVDKRSCDGLGGNGRICVHTYDNSGGYRINDIQGLNRSSDYEKLVFSFDGGNSGVPEPATWALMISGFGLTGATLRRRRVIAA